MTPTVPSAEDGGRPQVQDTAPKAANHTASMVERVARALDRVMYGGTTYRPGHPQELPEQALAREHDRHKLMLWSRAAIEALREPTEAMEDAYWQVQMGEAPGAAETLSAMIDAALSHPQGTGK